jgi:hypothetical protein
MTDFRALCAELLEALENAIRVIYNEDGTKHISTADPVIAKADAALAQPEPQGPSGDEIYKLALEGDFLVDAGDGFSCMVQDEVEFARAVLTRWGHPAIEPVPVAERLPGPQK